MLSLPVSIERHEIFHNSAYNADHIVRIGDHNAEELIHLIVSLCPNLQTMDMTGYADTDIIRDLTCLDSEAFRRILSPGTATLTSSALFTHMLTEVNW